MFFADDLLLFYRVDIEGTNCITNLLNSFYAHSGHRVNKNKTQVFFSNPEDVERMVSNKLGFHQVNDLGKYLGMPLLHNRVSPTIFQFVVDKVRGKLSNWEA